MTLDFKEKKHADDKRPFDSFEAAKDVAAFANAAGGTLLIGAKRDGDRLDSYIPLDPPEAAAYERNYELAVRDRCKPGPRIDFERFEHDSGIVLGVHVSPFPAVVAVSVRGDATDGYGKLAWVFFSRVTTHAKEFSPEILPMLMTPEIRRIAILLRSIPREAPINVVRRTRHEGGREAQSTACWLEDDSVDEMRNVVTFRRKAAAGATIEIRIPIDQIRTVFPGRKDNDWNVDVDHYWDDVTLTEAQRAEWEASVLALQGGE